MKQGLNLFLCWLIFSPAQAATILKTSGQQESEPKYVQQADRVGGICVDIFRAVERVQPTLRITGDQALIPLKRLENDVLQGKLDLFCGLGENDERKALFIYLKPAIYTVSYHLAVRVDDPIEIKNWDDVRQLGEDGRILVNFGSGAVSRLQKLGGLKVDDMAYTSGRNYRKLLAKYGRFYYYRQPGFDTDIEQNGVKGKVKILPTVMEIAPFYILFNRNISASVIEQFEAALRELEAKGELSAINQRWSQPRQ